MVNSAHEVLTIDTRKYQLFRNLLAELIVNDDNLKDDIKGTQKHDMFSVFQCGDSDDDADDDADGAGAGEGSRTSNVNINVNTLVRSYIIELLRFLAMKVLLESIPATNTCTNTNTKINTSNFQRMPSMKNPNRYPTNECNLVPSTALLDAWKALLLLPLVYNDVCAVMGCDGPLDFDAQDVVLDYHNTNAVDTHGQIHKARQDYRFTLVTYEKLYLTVPKSQFWSRLNMDEEQDRDTTMSDHFSNIFEKIAVFVKETIEGRDDSIPSSVRVSTYE